jgi:cell wall-associated NlpC family hydrolase
MRHLLFVSVAVVMISATSLSLKAQTAVNAVKVGLQQKKAVQFIEGIEVKHEAQVSTEPDVWVVPVKKVEVPEVAKVAVITTAIATVSKAAIIENCSPLQFKYAQRMDVEVETLTNTKLYEAIENWWATRYCYGGTTKRGVDCSALTGALVNESLGITLPRTARAQYAECRKIRKDNLIEGDLVFFNTRGGISHVGLYLGNNYFVHASVHAGVTISSLNDSYYSKKFIGGGRMKSE